MKDLSKLPDNLPIPKDDGACDHLLGKEMPSVDLLSTDGRIVNIAKMSGNFVLFFYPMIGRPDAPPLIGWNDIPGARGCTPQSCAFRDQYSFFTDTNIHLFGVSAQNYSDQIESKNRLHLPFELLNDSKLSLTSELNLPVFQYNNLELIKRLTLIVTNGYIKKVFYPVFPPNENAEDVISWFKNVQS